MNHPSNIAHVFQSSIIIMATLVPSKLNQRGCFHLIFWPHFWLGHNQWTHPRTYTYGFQGFLCLNSSSYHISLFSCFFGGALPHIISRLYFLPIVWSEPFMAYQFRPSPFSHSWVSYNTLTASLTLLSPNVGPSYAHKGCGCCSSCLFVQVLWCNED